MYQYFVFFLISSIFSFSYKTHSFLGKITEEYLDKYNNDILFTIKSNIGNISLAEASVWADKIKNKPEYKWSKTLHYIDIMTCEDHKIEELNRKYCENNCISSIIMEYVFDLKNTNYKRIEIGSKSDNVNYFKFLIHFLQDFNQPLHIVGFNRGGNNFKLIRNKNGRNKTINLHSFWDSEIPEYLLNNLEWNYLKELPSKNINTILDYNIYLLEIMDINKRIACDFIYGAKWNNVNYIRFEDYIIEAVPIQRILLNNYLELVINTLKFIYLDIYNKSKW
jgi:hypothetical protein